MALLPSARVAVRLALANYLRTNLQAAWPSLVITENWPNPQKIFPPQALTVLAPTAGHVIEYHQPVVWKTTSTASTSTVMYSYGKMEIPLQLDVWTQFESVRDDLASSVLPLLNQNVEVTLGVATLSNLANAPGLVLIIPTYSNVTAEYRFDPVPAAIETSIGATVADWRYQWNGWATIYLIQNETQPLMKDVTVRMGMNGDPAQDVFPFSYEGQVLQDSPALYWRMGDATGATVVADISGNSNTGAVTSPANVTFGAVGLLAVGSTPNDVNPAASASSALPSVRSSIDVGVTTTFSVEWWIKPSTITANGNDVGQAFGTFYARQNADGSVTVGTTLAQALTTAPSTYAVGKTVHCVFTYDGASGRFYVNGQLSAGPGTMPAPAGAINAFGFGIIGPWQALVQEIAVYRTALPATRILAHYYLGSIGP